jgi:hypothetical protein
MPRAAEVVAELHPARGEPGSAGLRHHHSTRRSALPASSPFDSRRTSFLPHRSRSAVVARRARGPRGENQRPADSTAFRCSVRRSATCYRRDHPTSHGGAAAVSCGVDFADGTATSRLHSPSRRRGRGAGAPRFRAPNATDAAASTGVPLPAVDALVDLVGEMIISQSMLNHPAAALLVGSVGGVSRRAVRARPAETRDRRRRDGCPHDVGGHNLLALVPDPRPPRATRQTRLR